MKLQLSTGGRAARQLLIRRRAKELSVRRVTAAMTCQRAVRAWLARARYSRALAVLKQDRLRSEAWFFKKALGLMRVHRTTHRGLVQGVVSRALAGGVEHGLRAQLELRLGALQDEVAAAAAAMATAGAAGAAAEDRLAVAAERERELQGAVGEAELRSEEATARIGVLERQLGAANGSLATADERLLAHTRQDLAQALAEAQAANTAAVAENEALVGRLAAATAEHGRLAAALVEATRAKECAEVAHGEGVAAAAALQQDVAAVQRQLEAAAVELEGARRRSDGLAARVSAVEAERDQALVGQADATTDRDEAFLARDRAVIELALRG
jgi:chromosome segregation ATPase